MRITFCCVFVLIFDVLVVNISCLLDTSNETAVEKKYTITAK